MFLDVIIGWRELRCSVKKQHVCIFMRGCFAKEECDVMALILLA